MSRSVAPRARALRPALLALFASAALAACTKGPPPPQPVVPAAPADLTATAFEGRITLSWSPAALATGYTVRRGAAATGPFLRVGSTEGTTFTNTGLAAKTTFFYVVNATNAAGDGPDSPVASATTPDAAASPPPAPAGLTATGGAGQISLAWSAATGATGYRVVRGAQSGGPYAPLASPTSTSYVDGGLAASARYFYVVQAVGPGGTSANSNEATAVTNGPGAPAAPALPTATGGTRQVALSWAAVSGATGYLALRGTAAGGPYTQFAAPTSTSATDAGLSDGTRYTYVVRATGPGGTSGNSPEASALTLPAVPAGLTATGGQNQIALSWAAVASATRYEVFRAATSTVPVSGAPLASPTSTAFTDAGLADSATWFYVVRAVNGTGPGPATAAQSATTNPPVASPPPAPASLTATGGSKQVALSWTASAGATGYAVLRGAASGGPYPTQAGTPTSTAFTDTGLSDGTAYFYVVRATNAAGSSTPSGEASGLTLPASPGAFTAAGGQNQITLSWSAAASATKYEVFRAATSTVPTVGTPLASPTSTAFADTGLADNATWFYVVRAVNGTGAGPATAAQSATTNPPVAAAPPAPASLTASGGVRSITLSWPAVATASDYLLQRGSATGTWPDFPAPGKAIAPSACSVSSTCTFLDDDGGAGLTEGSTHTYVVYARNGAGTSASHSPEASAVVLPAVPAGVGAAAVSGAARTIHVTWTAVVNAPSGQAYAIERSTTSTGAFSNIANATLSACSGSACAYDDAAAPADATTYWYRVAAFNKAAVLGTFSAPASATTVPVAPALTATPRSGAQGTIDLAWTTPPGAATYKLWRDQGASPAGAATFTLNATSTADTGQGDHATHAYVAAAVDASGNRSPFSALQSATTAPGQPAPAAVAADGVNGRIDVTWSATTGAATYSVTRGGAPVCTAVTSTTCADTSLGDNVTASYLVTATDAATPAVSSAAGSASATTVPAVPALTVTTPQAPPLTGELDLSWTASAGASVTYVVQRSATGANTFSTIAPTATGPTSAKDAGLADSTGFDYRVKAVSGGKGSAWSTAKTGFTTPPQVTGLSASAGGSTSVNLSWTAVAVPGGTALTYRVFRGTSPVSTTGAPLLTVAGPGSGTISTTDGSAAPSTTYTYVVVAQETGHSLNGPTSAEKSATTTTAAPGVLSATARTGQLAVDLGWGAINLATGYSLWRADATGASCPASTTTPGNGWGAAAIASFGASATSTLDSDVALAAGHTYCYLLVPSGAGSPSNIPSAILAAPAPGTLTATTLASDPAGRTIRVGWDYGGAPTGTAQLTIYACAAAGTGGCTPTTASRQVTFVASPGASGTFDDTALAPATTYTYLALGSNVSGAYAAGAPTNAALTGPAQPAGLTALAGTSGGKNRVSLAWSPNAANTFTSYLVRRGADGLTYADFGAGVSVPSSSVAYVDDNGGAGLPDSSTFHYVVLAVSNRGGAGLFTSASSTDASASTAGATPAGLTATASIPSGKRQIALSWLAATGASGYDIYRSATSPVDLTTPYATSTGTGFTDSAGGAGLTAGTTFFYRVTVSGDHSAANASNEASALTAPGAPTLGALVAYDGRNPGAPVNCGSGYCVAIAWTPPANAASFNLYRRVQGGSFGAALLTGLTGAGTVDANGIQADTVYEYQLEAVNSGGTGPLSGVGQVTSLPAPLLTFSADPSTDGSTPALAKRVVLSWTLPAGSKATGVWLYRAPAGGGFDYAAPLAANASTGYVDSTVAPDATYDYAARPGILGAGPSASSTFDTGNLTLPDAPVVSFAGSTAVSTTWCGTPGCIQLSWPALPADVTAYTISGSDTGVTYTQLATSTPASICTAGTCTFTEQNLGTGKVRYYRVFATNATGTGPKGSLNGASTPPGAPGSLIATPGVGKIDLAWNSPSGATQIKLQRRLTSAGGAFADSATVVNQTNCTDAGASPGAPINCSLGALTDGESYDYQLTAQVSVSGTAIDGGSATVTGKVLPAAPTGLSATSTASGTATLAWSSSNCATFYDLFQSATSTGGFAAATPATKAGLASPCSTSGTLSVDVSGLADGSTYWFRIDARNQPVYDPAAVSPLTAPVSVTLKPPAPTGLTATPGNAKVDLSWSAAAGATSYRIYRADQGGAVLATVATTSSTDATVLNGTTYSYQVSAVNAGGESAKSSSASATPTAGSVQPPGNVSAVGLNGGVRVLWDAATNATGYTVYQRPTSATSTGELPVTACTDVSGGAGLRKSCAFTDSPLTGAAFANRTGPFFFIVRSLLSGTPSADSGEASASPARELCVSLPEMSAVAAIDADTPLAGLTDAQPRRWFGNTTQLALPVAVAIDATRDELYALNQAANSITVYSPRTAAADTPPVRSIAGQATTLATPVAMALDTSAHELFVLDRFGASGRVLVYDGNASGASAPKRQFPSSSTYFTALALGPGAAEFTVTDGATVWVYPRTGWTSSAPTPNKTWTVTGLSAISALAYDPTVGELWAGSSGSATVAAVSSTAATGALTPRTFTLALSTRRTSALAFDPVGFGGTPEIVVGSYSTSGLRFLLHYPRNTTGSAPAASYALTDTTPSTLGRPTSIVLDPAGGDVVFVANAPSDPANAGSAPYLQSVASYQRRAAGAGALLRKLDGPYQTDPLLSTVRTDEPLGLATTSLALDRMWVANRGLPGGAASNVGSQANPYAMTDLLAAPSPLAYAADTSVLGNTRGQGVAVNEADDELYVSDGASDLRVFRESTGALLRSVSSTNSFAASMGLFWDGRAGEQKLYVAQRSGSASPASAQLGSIDVLKRAADGSFSRPSLAPLTNPIVLADGGNNNLIPSPAAVWVATNGGTSVLWVANSVAISGQVKNGAGATRINLANGTVNFDQDVFANTSDAFAPSAIIADQTRVWLGVSPKGGAANGNWGIQVLNNAVTGTPALQGTLQVVGGSSKVGGLAWCN